MSRFSIVRAFAFVMLACLQASGLDFHVATNGDDTNPGTENRPFHSLERAREEIRHLKATDAWPSNGLSIILHNGWYHRDASFILGAQESGTGSSPVTWTAATHETARLDGGIILPANAFSASTDKKILERLDASARGHVLQADLRALGITRLDHYPDDFRGAPAVPELFFNDQRQRVARWPNDGWTTIAKILDHDTTAPLNQSNAFVYSGDRPARWNIPAGVWLCGFWCFDWYEETVRVQAIDPGEHQIALSKIPHYGIRQGNPSPRRYYAMNVLEELDQPGEYYISPDSGFLYFWPPSDPAAARIVLSTLNAPVLLLTNASYTIIRDLTVEAGLGDGIDVRGGRSNRIDACEVRNVRQLGISVSNGTGHQVTACEIHDTGTGGLVLSGGDRRTLAPAGLEAMNNRIWNFSQHQLTYAAGLTLDGVGNHAAHNEIFAAPHMAVGINGNDHIFEFNFVHDVCTASDDAGALYKGRNPSSRGNLIRYNYWRDIGNPMGSGTAAIYFDDGDGGDTVFGNIFLRCGYPGKGTFGAVFSHGGHDLRAENNIFIDCKRALGSSPWNDQRWKDALSGQDWQYKLLQEVDISRAPYTNHYPALIGFMDPPPGRVRMNQAKNNVLSRCARPNNGNWTNAPAETWSTDDDPGFVDFAKGDLRLRPDSEVYKQLPSFSPIPFEKIGIETSKP